MLGESVFGTCKAAIAFGAFLAFGLPGGGCKGSSSGNNGGSEADAGDGHDASSPDASQPLSGGARMWLRVRVQANADLAGLAVAEDGTVDIAYVGSVAGERGIVWQRLGAAPEMVSVSGGTQLPPAVARDAGGSVHVVWGTGGPNEIRYAVRNASGWAVETIATDRFRPDLAVTADGTPHVAFVDQATGNAMAYYAVRSASGWQIATVHATEWFAKSQVGIALDANGTPIVAAPAKDLKGIWVARATGAGGWTVEDLAGDRRVTGPLALAVATAGIAVAFKDQSSTLVAFRPSGTAAWAIESASHHDSSDAPLDVVVTPSGPIAVSDVDVQYPNGFALLERTGAGWTGQLIAGSDCDGAGITAAVDPTGQPVVALTCNRTLYSMTVAGHYPADWAQRCASAATEMCNRACKCGSGGEDCCWALGGTSTCTSSYGCASNAQAALCGDPSISPTALQKCRDQLPSLTCAAGNPLDLAGDCAPLYEPFAAP